ncbi:hypothetical protein OBV_34220 [Oscillibacter valericigenes Sjm18-20]|nr:hypothetical protein OBV_34220 [Oscillibacter valericigenes Sjm18-20]
MEGKINVATEKLRSTATEFGTQGQQIRNLTAEMINIVNTLSTTWTGEAAQAYHDKFVKLDDDITRMNNMIQEHVTDLNNMADAYEKGEATILDQDNTLSSDVIQ